MDGVGVISPSCLVETSCIAEGTGDGVGMASVSNVMATFYPLINGSWSSSRGGDRTIIC